MNSQRPIIWTRNFILIGIAGLLLFTAFYILLPTLPLYLIRNLAISKSKTGFILAAYTLVALLVRPLTGFLIDRHGRKLFYLAGFSLFSIVFVFYPLADSLLLMLLLRLVHGALWGITTTTANTIAVDVIPAQRRGEALGYYGLSMTIPMAAGPFIGLQLSHDGNYTRMFLIAAVLGFAGFLCSLLVRFPKIKQRHSVFDLKTLFEPTALPGALTLGLIMSTYGGVVSFSSLYATQYRLGHAGLFFLIYAIGITLARLLSGRIFDRKGPLALVVVSVLILSAGFWALSVFRTVGGFHAAAFLTGLGNGVLMPTLQAMVNNMVVPSKRGAANSTLFTGLDLGIGAGMIFTGYLAGTPGLPFAFLVCSGINLAALAFFYFTYRHYQKNKLHVTP